MVGYAYQFRAIDSPVHRLSGGWKLVIASLMSAAAVALRDPWELGLLVALNLGYYLLARLSLVELWKDTRFFLLQMLIIVSLYLIRYGLAGGLWPGFRTALQIFLFFLPGAVALRTTQGNELIKGFRRIFPAPISFALYTSLRFVPFFAREFQEIAMAQRLRGVPMSFRQCLNPFNWKDLFSCLAIPMVVRALKTANEAALSAEARGFGRKFVSPHGKRH